MKKNKINVTEGNINNQKTIDNDNQKPKEQERTRIKKELVIEALRECFGNVTMACEQVDIAKKTFYEWKKEDPEFVKRIENLEVNHENNFVDFAERGLLGKIQKGDTTAIIFALKTRGKKRGYIERQELEVTDNSNLEMKAKLSSLPDDVLSALEDNIDSNINEKT